MNEEDEQSFFLLSHGCNHFSIYAYNSPIKLCIVNLSNKYCSFFRAEHKLGIVFVKENLRDNIDNIDIT